MVNLEVIVVGTCVNCIICCLEMAEILDLSYVVVCSLSELTLTCFMILEAVFGRYVKLIMYVKDTICWPSSVISV